MVVFLLYICKKPLSVVLCKPLLFCCQCQHVIIVFVKIIIVIIVIFIASVVTVFIISIIVVIIASFVVVVVVIIDTMWSLLTVSLIVKTD